MKHVAQDWHKGTLEKPALWSIYTSLNIVGSLLCFIGMAAVLALKHKNSNDIFVAGLLFGCFSMSVACGLQCLLNLIDDKGYFSWGLDACAWEAFFHIASILTQFLSIFMIGIRNYLVVVRNYHLSFKAAIWLELGVIAAGWGGTAIFAEYSEIYLLPAGVYCLYRPLSPAMLYWFVPTMLTSLITVTGAYIAIFRTTQQLQQALGRIPSARLPALLAANLDVPSRSEAVSAMNTQAPAVISTNGTAPTSTSPTTTTASALLSAQVAKRSVIYVLVFLVGWGPGVLLVAWELFVGTASEYLDSLLGVNGSLHSVVVPLLYAWFNLRLRTVLSNWLHCRSSSQVESYHDASLQSKHERRASNGRQDSDRRSKPHAAAYRVDSRQDSRPGSRSDFIARAKSPLSAVSNFLSPSSQNDVETRVSTSSPLPLSPQQGPSPDPLALHVRVDEEDNTSPGTLLSPLSAQHVSITGATLPTPTHQVQGEAEVEFDVPSRDMGKKYRRLTTQRKTTEGDSPEASQDQPDAQDGEQNDTVEVVLEKPHHKSP